MKKGLIIVFVFTFTLFLALVGSVAFKEVEGRSVSSPSGRYRAVVSFRNYESWLPCAPGDSSGKPGYITIYDQDGTSYGTVPVGMISQLSDLRWTDKGARIHADCEWDFGSRTCRYWNDSQTRETVITAR
jgi:hypothetical protein